MRTMLLAALFAVSPLAAKAEVFDASPKDKACVAWKTKKTMFLLKKLEPAGVSCAAKVEPVAEKEGRRLRVAVPVASFDSGEPARDKEVLKILGASVQPELIFLSRPYSAKEWGALLRGESDVLEGSLKVAEKDFPISLSVSVADGTASGAVRTRFDAFGIPAPAVAGGLVAKVADELALSYRLPLAAVPR